MPNKIGIREALSTPTAVDLVIAGMIVYLPVVVTLMYVYAKAPLVWVEAERIWESVADLIG